MKGTVMFIVTIILAAIGIVTELYGVCHTDVITMVSGCGICLLAIIAVGWSGYPR